MIMKRITSPDNILIKTVKQLKTKKGRDTQGCYIIEGEKSVAEAVIYKAGIISIYCSEDFRQSKRLERLDGINDIGLRLIETDNKTFSSISDTETPQGVLAVIRKPNFRIISENWLVLDRIQDPGNLGTIVRTADAAGFGTVIAIKGGSDIYAPKVVRASAGAFFRIRSTVLDSAGAAVALARKHGKKLIAADPTKGISCFETDLTAPLALIIGNEGGGLNTLFLSSADLRVSIPMRDGAESLNASVAASVIMFEAVRQSFRI